MKSWFSPRSTTLYLVVLAAACFVVASVLFHADDAVEAQEVRSELSWNADPSEANDTWLASSEGDMQRTERRGATDAPAVAAWSKPAAPTRDELLLGAVPALRGRVMEVDGAAVPRAELVVQLEGGFVAFACDASGSFALELPPTPRIELEVRAEGFLPARFASLPFEGDVELALDRTLAVRGRVVDLLRGEGIAKAELVARRLSAVIGVPRVSETTLSSKDGHFSIDGLGPGDFELRASAPGFTALRKERVTLRRGQSDELLLELEPALELRVLVLDEDGHALPQAEVLVRQEAEGARARIALNRTCSEIGEAEFTGLAEGTVRVIARCADYAAETTEVVLAHPSAGQAALPMTVELRLSRGISVEGLVLNPEGTPVSGAHVVLLHPKRRVPKFAEPDEEDNATISDESGNFRLRGLRPGGWKICAFDHDLAFAIQELPLGARDQQRAPKQVQLSLLPPFGIRGHLLDSNGGVVPDVLLSFGPEHGFEALGTQHTTRSDAEGRFEVGPFPRLPIELRAEAVGYHEARSTVAPPKHAATAEVHLTLRGVYGVSGRATDVYARAVGPARVTLQEVLSGRVERRKPRVFRGACDMYGNFFVPDVLPGSYAVTVDSFGHAPVPIDRAMINLPGDEHITITLEVLERPPTGTLVGLVRSTTSGEALPTFHVEGDGLSGGSVSYGAAGRFEWAGIESGTGDIEIQAPRYARRLIPDIQVWGGSRVDLGVVMLELGADLALDTRLHATDRDVGRKQKVEREFRMTLRPLDAESMGQRARSLSVSGRDGKARVASLLPGRWDIDVRAQNGWSGHQVVELAAGANSVQVELISPGEVQRRREAARAAERKRRAEAERAKRAAASAAGKD